MSYDENIIDAEYLTQVEDAGFQAAADGVLMALEVLRYSDDPSMRCVNYICRYGNWEEIQNLPVDVRRYCFLRNYGIEEYEALPEEERLEGSPRSNSNALHLFFRHTSLGQCPDCKKTSAEKTDNGYFVGPCTACKWDYEDGIN